MECRNHPGVAAVAACAGCAESYCANCLVQVRGTRYCGQCKGLALSGPGVAAVPPGGGVPCAEASDALKLAVLSIFCFGIFVGPIAISKALQARKKIAADPTLAGQGKATAAIVIASITIVFWVIGMLQKVSAVGRP